MIIRRAKRMAAPLLFSVFLLTACSIPQFGGNERAPAEFEATPYALGESVQVATAPRDDAPAAGAGTNSQVNTNEAPGASAAPSDAAAPAADEAAAPSSAAAEDTSSAAPAAANAGPTAYTAEVVAKNRVDVVAEVSGMVLDLLPQVGDVIAAGDLVAEIEASTLEAQRAQALAGLQAAQAQLDLLLDQVEPEEADLEAARAAVNAAAASYNRAREGATEEDRRAALAQLKQAEAAVTVAQAGYNRVKGNPLIGALPESLQLQQATLAVEAAQAQYDKVLKGSTADIIAGAYAQLANARAQLERLEKGPEEAQVRALEAQVKQAETSLYLSQLQLDKTSITAPVDGIVVRLNVAEGAMVAPGTPIIELMSPEKEVVVAVEEARLSQVEPGLAVTIRVDAYPDRTFTGEVVRIAPELNAATRTVDVTIRPLDDDGALAPGMFATVIIE